MPTVSSPSKHLLLVVATFLIRRLNLFLHFESASGLVTYFGQDDINNNTNRDLKSAVHGAYCYLLLGAL